MHYRVSHCSENPLAPQKSHWRCVFYLHDLKRKSGCFIYLFPSFCGVAWLCGCLFTCTSWLYVAEEWVEYLVPHSGSWAGTRETQHRVQWWRLAETFWTSCYSCEWNKGWKREDLKFYPRCVWSTRTGRIG
jgi:hypothetical protein